MLGFLDHLLRETPSHRHIAVKRSYFGRTTEERMILGSGIEAMKGVYQSIRAAQVAIAGLASFSCTDVLYRVNLLL